MQALLLGALKIEIAEFFAYLPEVEVCPWLKDIAPRTGAGVTESLGVMFAKSAWGFGRSQKHVEIFLITFFCSVNIQAITIKQSHTQRG